MKIKVCGLKDPNNILAVAELKPDYIGFIQYHRSPRFIGDLAVNTVNNTPGDIKKVLVVVNEDINVINSLIDRYGFDAVQLHGAEAPEFCAKLKNKVEVFKAFGIEEGFDFDLLIPYVGKVNYFLFDTKTPLRGGSGQTFNWAILDNYKLAVPFFLSGGLSLDNLAEVKNIKHPAFYGVDLNSRFETAPGIKDIDKLTQAFALVKEVKIS